MSCVSGASVRTAITHARLAFVASGLLLSFHTDAWAAGRFSWGGDARLDGFHTTDLFPGGSTREPDRGARLMLKPEGSLHFGKLRLKGWARATVERYDRWTARDLERWEFGSELKRGPHRFRLYGGWTNDELYFPTSSGGAYLDRRHVGGELRENFAPGWFAGGTLVYERENFVPAYNERDAHRWTTQLELQREFGPKRSAALSYFFRRADSITDLYTYDQNSVRLVGSWTLPLRSSTEVTAEYRLRNYRTGQPFAANFSRRDDRWRLLGRLACQVAGPLSIEVYDDWRDNDSTRGIKIYQVNTVGVALAASR
jgi:hypothetical protein